MSREAATGMGKRRAIFSRLTALMTALAPQFYIYAQAIAPAQYKGYIFKGGICDVRTENTISFMPRPVLYEY